MGFEIQSSNELRALFRAILAVKFPEKDAQDTDLPASPHLANVAARIRERLENLDKDELGERSTKMWKEWNNLDKNRKEWDLALRFASSAFSSQWSDWSSEKRRDVCRDLLSPFRLEESILNSFVDDLNSRMK